MTYHYDVSNDFCAFYGFSSGRLNVYQTLLVKPGLGGENGLPLSRGDWYREGLDTPGGPPSQGVVGQG